MLNGPVRQSPFVGRRRELDLLQGLWESSKPELLILYGRRRVGKTRLLTQWLGSAQPRALYWVAEPTSTYDQLHFFSQTLYNFANPQAPAPEGFTYANWGQAFQQIAQLSQQERPSTSSGQRPSTSSGQRLAVMIDEFTYLLAAESGIAGALKNAWDHVLSQSNLLLILSGSHIGMMERHLLAYQAPLYGRATSRLLLPPLPFAATREFFPQYHPDERVAVYAMLGGIPAYWERFDPQLSVEGNLRRQFLSTGNLLQDEPRLLLQDFISEAHNYVAILRAIAYGARTPKEIAGLTGLNAKHVPAYLSRLLETGFVERRIPVTDPPNSRQGRHHITDPFLRFYYRFLSRRQAQLALGVQDQALEEIKRHLPDFIGAHTWEELSREWLLRAGGKGELPFVPDQVGGAWNRKAQVDVVGINSMEKTIILGECKWSPRPTGRAVLKQLLEKTGKILPSSGKWKVYYLGFARAGWTPEAHQFAREIKGSGDHPWDVAGMRLVDLDQVDRDLAKWSA